MSNNKSSTSAAAKKSNDAEKDRLHAAAVVERVINQGIDLTADYDQWVELGFAFASQGEEGRPLFHRISYLHPGYSMEDCDAKFSNCMRTSRNAVSLGTFFHIAEQAGVDISLPEELRPHRGRPRKSSENSGDETEDKLTSFQLAKEKLNELASFRYNVVRHCIEILPRLVKETDEDNAWIRLDDRTFDNLYVNVRNERISIPKEDLRSIINDKDFSEDYHPLREYLTNLAPWDGERDYITEIFNLIQFGGGDEFREFCLQYLRKWFIGNVALWAGYAEDNQLMPVFVGPPHAGKTYLCNHLVPPELREYTKTIYPGEKYDKDCLISISENCLVTLDEFELSRRTSNTLRAIITSTSSNVRAPFGRYSKQRSRLASFVGTCNDLQYITDPVGDRRYLSVHMTSTQWFTDDTLPLDKAYAQAWHTVSKGNADDYRLTIDDSRRIEEHNENFTEPDLCEQLILTLFRVPGPDEQGEAMALADIIKKLHEKNYSNEINTRNVSRALKNLGFNSRKTNKCNRWYVIEKPDGENGMEAVNEGHRMYVEQHPEPSADTALLGL